MTAMKPPHFILCITMFLVLLGATQFQAVAGDAKRNYKKVSFAELERTNTTETYLFERYDEYKQGYVIYFAGDLKIEGDLDLDRLENNGFTVDGNADAVIGIWVTGDLHVSGSILNRSNDSIGLLLVEKKTRAENILLGGTEIHLTGGAEIKQAIIAPSEAGGSLRISGNLRAMLILNDDSNLFEIPDNSNGLIVGFENSSSFADISFTIEDYHNIFLAEYLKVEKDEEDDDYESISLQTELLVEAITNKKQFIKDHLPTTSKRWDHNLLEDTTHNGLFADFEGEDLEKVPQAILANMQITSLNLTDNNFKQYPSEINVLKNLKYLDLSNNPVDVLPKEPQTAGLECFLFYESSHLDLKDVVDFALKHTKLKMLGYSYLKPQDLDDQMKELDDLSESMEGLQQGLKTDLLNSIRSAIMPWKKPLKNEGYEKLQKNFQFKEEDHLLVKFPEDLNHIEELFLHDLRFKSLRLKRPMITLKTLSLMGSIYKLNDAPRWTDFPALTTIDLSLNEGTASGSELIVLNSLKDLPMTVTNLHLNDWFSFDDEIILKLFKIPEHIQHLKNLEYLSLANSQINVKLLIKVLPNYTKLQTLDLEGIEISYFQKRKLGKILPKGCELILDTD